MTTRSQTWLIGVTAAAATMSLSIPASAATDDQARLDAAIVEFNERMVAAGWESQGPSDEPSETDDEPSEGDEAFAACLGDVAIVFEDFPGGSGEFPGEVARRFSDDFVFTAPTEGSETTESIFSISAEETVAAFALSVDEAHVDAIERFIETIGSKQTSDCMNAAFEADLAAGTDPTDPLEIAFDVDYHVSTEADLGVGDSSAGMDFDFSIDMFGAPIEFAGTFGFAQVKGDLVGLLYGVTNGDESSPSGFDLVVELRALVDSLAG